MGFRNWTWQHRLLESEIGRFSNHVDIDKLAVFYHRVSPLSITVPQTRAVIKTISWIEIELTDKNCTLQGGVKVLLSELVGIK